MTTKDVRLANEAWEALYRSMMTIARELKAGDVWEDLLESEYGVLYATVDRTCRIADDRPGG